MNLTEIKKDSYAIVKNIDFIDNQEEITLNNFGLIIGERIKLVKLNSFKKAYFIKIDDNQFYINEPLAKRIEVEYE